MKKIVTNAFLTFEGATHVEVNKINGDNSIVCNLIQEQTDEEGVTTEVKRECNFIFLEGAYPCELTDEDMEVLRPTVIQDENYSL